MNETSKLFSNEESETMRAKEILNLIDWLRKQGFDNDKVVECLEFVEGRQDPKKEKDN